MTGRSFFRPYYLRSYVSILLRVSGSFSFSGTLDTYGSLGLCLSGCGQKRLNVREGGNRVWLWGGQEVCKGSKKPFNDGLRF
jgi:hypothetical protein